MHTGNLHYTMVPATESRSTSDHRPQRIQIHQPQLLEELTDASPHPIIQPNMYQRIRLKVGQAPRH